MKFVVLSLAFVSVGLLVVGEESPVGAGDSLKDAVTDATGTSLPNATALQNEPVNSEQKVSNLSVSKDKPEESTVDKVSAAANDAKDAVNGAVKSAGQAVSDAAGNAADKIPEAANGSAVTTFSLLSAVFMVALALCTSQ